MRVNEAFRKITILAEKLGFKNLNEYPGIWEYKIDDNWTVKVNEHDDMVDSVQGHHCLVLYHGWPRGMFHRLGGWMQWSPNANEHVFMEAVRKKLTNLDKSSKAVHLKRRLNFQGKRSDLSKENLNKLNYWTRLDD